MKQSRGKLREYQYADFYVAPNGNDGWSGKLSEPNADGTDGPFATIERARDALRLASFRQYRNMYVLIRGGEYRLKKPVVFDGRDTHYESYQKIFAAYPGETPVFSSDTPITGWRLAENVPGLPESSVGKVYEADIPELPVGKKRFYTMYEDGKMLTRARSAGMQPCEYIRCLPYFDANTVINIDRKTLHYREDVFRNWDNPEDIEVFVMPGRGFVANYVPLESVDTEGRNLHTAIPATYVMGKVNSQALAIDGGTFRVENVIDFLTEPGNWTIDTKRGKIYYYPLNGKPGNVTFPALTEYIRVDGHERGEIVKGIVFEGLTFARGDRAVVKEDDLGVLHEWDYWNKDNAMVRFRDAEDCVIRNCRLCNSGSAGIRLDLHCQSNLVEGNLIDYVGGTGVLLCGYGPGRVNVNRCNKVINNHIHHCGTFYIQSSAILLWQSSENIVRHNLLHHIAYDAIVLCGVRASYYNAKGFLREMVDTIRRAEIPAEAQFHTIDASTYKDINRQWSMVAPYYETRNNLIEDNEIFMAMQKLFDGNAIYLSDIGNGNMIHRNYVHHLNGIGMQQAIRTDAAVKNTMISDNILYNCTGGGINTKHFENHVVNNIVGDIRDIVFKDDENNIKRQFIGYIALLEVNRADMPVNANLRVERNIFYKPATHQPFYRQKRRDEGLVEGNLEETEIDSNLYYEVHSKDHGASRLKYYQSRGVDAHSKIGDPLFVDLKKGNFHLKENSPARDLGFEDIPYENIGLTVDFPEKYEAIVRQQLGDNYADFEHLESLCVSGDGEELELDVVDNI